MDGIPDLSNGEHEDGLNYTLIISTTLVVPVSYFANEIELQVELKDDLFGLCAD